MRELPCSECAQPCCREANHGWPHSAVQYPYVNGRCPQLTKEGRCAVYRTRPANCAAWRCAEDAVFRMQHPEVNALLISKGL
jgi:hypothetical protein